jgi:hypothetical protein
MNTPMLRFVSDLFESGMYHCGWIGPWPPPEEFGVFVGMQTGLVKVYEQGQVDADVLRDAESVAHHALFRRISYSQLPVVDGLDHVVRGAEYRLEQRLT